VESSAEPTSQRERFHLPVWLSLCFFLAVATFFLWEEHKAHILGVLPYALLLLCPIVHLFMHRGHGGHGAGHSEREAQPHQEGGAT
jgi:hypothetical protein